jgi:acyl carrier protein
VKPSRAELVDELRRQLRGMRRTVVPDMPETALFRDVGFDSLDLVELVARIESVYRRSVPRQRWPALTSLGAVADAVLELL